MLAKPQLSVRESGLRLWVVGAVVPLVIQAALSAMVPKGAASTAVDTIVFSFVVVLVAGIATVNAVRSRNSIRLFWAFLALGFWAWSFNGWVWLYSLWMGDGRPTPLGLVIPLAAHTVFMIAAVASRPHVKPLEQRGYRLTLNLLLLLFFWTFIYALLLVGPGYVSSNAPFLLRLGTLYFAENVFLVVILSVLFLRVRRPWKSIYGHFLGASLLYAVISLASTLSLVFWGYFPTWVDVTITASVCWFFWMALQGQKLATQLEQSVQPDTSYNKYVPLMAMLSVVAIPIIGVMGTAANG